MIIEYRHNSVSVKKEHFKQRAFIPDDIMADLEAKSMGEHRAKDMVVRHLGLDKGIAFLKHWFLFVALVALEIVSFALLALVLHENGSVQERLLGFFTNGTIEENSISSDRVHGLALLILYGVFAPQLVVFAICLDLVPHWRLALAKCMVKSTFLFIFYVVALHTFDWSEVQTTNDTIYGLRLHPIVIMATSVVIWAFFVWSIVDFIRNVAPRLANIRIAGYILQVVTWRALQHCLYSLVHAALYLVVLVGLVCLELGLTPPHTKLLNNSNETFMTWRPILMLMTGLITTLFVAIDFTLTLRHHLLNHVQSLSYDQFKSYFGPFKGLYDPRRIFHSRPQTGARLFQTQRTIS